MFRPLLLLSAVLLTAGCTTLVNRRDLYRPAEASGPYTKELRVIQRGEGTFGVSHNRYYRPEAERGFFGVAGPDQLSESDFPDPRRNEGVFGISRPRD